MKRTMKKSLSMLLVFAMVFGMFSWMPVRGYAEGELDSLPLGASGVAITSADSYTCKEGEGGTFRVTATGTDYIEFTLSGEPEGVSLDDTGLLTIADTVEAGEYIFEITASDMDGIADSDTQDFTLTVEEKDIPLGDRVVITSADSFTCHAGGGGIFRITAAGAENIEFSLLGEPEGVTLDDTGLMTVADTLEAGEYIFEITASDADGVADSDSQSFTLTVESEPPVAGRITITSEAAYVCSVGEGGTFQITATGAENIEFSLLGEPEGVTLDDTGLLTVADTVEAGEYSFTVTASDADGVADPDSQSFTLAVHGAVPFMPLTLATEGDVCRIGETYYNSIETAVAEAKTGDVITLVDNITLRGSLVVDGKSIIINCDRFALMIDYYTAVGFSEGGTALLVKNGGSLKIILSEEGYPDPGVFSVYADIGVKAESGGQAEITGGGIYGVKYGLWADGADSVIIVHGPVQSEVNDIDQDIIHDRHGAYATNGGKIAINGNVTSANYGVVAEGTGSSVTVTEDVIANKEGTAKISDNSTGALAKDGGHIVVGGDVTSGRYGAYAEGADSRIDIDGDAVAASENEPLGSGYGVYAIQVAYVEVGGEAKGYNSGVTVETGGQATVKNATGTGPNSIGAYIGENSMGAGESSAVAATITVLGDAKGASTGALAENFGKITVGANAIGTEDSGARADGGAAIYIEGDATGYAFGAYAIGDLTNISIGGDAVATSETEPQGSGYGVYAIEVASVKVGGDARGYNSGVTVETGGQATVKSATGTGHNSIGAYIGENSMGAGESSAIAATIKVLGDAKGASNGVLAENFGTITVGANAIGTEDSGARAAGGAAIYIEGDATGYGFGAYAIGELTNISIGGDAVATSETEPQGSGYGAYAIQSASVKVGGDAKGYNSGVTVETGGQATVKNATSTGPNSIGACIGENSMGSGESSAVAATITVQGDAKGASYGALANSFGKITVGSNAIGEDNAGAFAAAGGVINVGGDARGGSSAARADGKNSRIEIEGNAIATSIYEGMDSPGAHATDNGYIHVGGDVTGCQYGVLVEQASSAGAAFDQLARVVVDGSVSATSSSGIGVANRGAVAIVGGDISAPVYVRILPQPEGIPATYIDLSAEDSKDQPENMGQGYNDYTWYYFENEAKTVRHSFTLVIGDGAECAIGSKRYEKLFDALSEVRTGETIKMLKDARYEGALRLSSGKSFTIDLSGKKVDIVSDVSGEAALTVINKSGISLKGSGEFNVTGVTAGVEVQTGGTVTITNATATDGYGAYIGTNGGGGFITVQKDAKGSKSGAYAESAGLITVGTPDWPGNTTGETEAGAYARNGGQIIIYGDATGKEYGVYAEGKDSRVSVGQSAKADGDGSAGAYAKDQGGITVTHNAEGTKYGVFAMEILADSYTYRPLDDFTSVRIGGTAKATHSGGIGVYNQGGIVFIDTGIEADTYITVGPQGLMQYPANDVTFGIGNYKDWPKKHIINEYDGQFDDCTWYYYQHFLEDGQGNPILDEEGNKKYDVIHSYTVVNGDNRDKVCEIVGGTQFTDLEKALEEIKRQEPDNEGKAEKDKKYAEVTIRLLKDIDYPNGIHLKNTKLTIDANGRNFNFGYGLSTTVGLHMDDSTLNVTGDGEVRASGIEAGIQLINGSKATLTGARSDTGVGANIIGGSSLVLKEDAEGYFHGIYAEGNSINVSVRNAIAVAQDGVGALARGDTQITISGIVKGGRTGAEATDWIDPDSGKTTPGGRITVKGNAEGGEAGVFASGKDAVIIVDGDATGSGLFSVGAQAENKAKVTVRGNANGGSYGASAQKGGSVTVNGDSIGGEGGAYARDKSSSVAVNGYAIGTAHGSYGAGAWDGGKVTVKVDAIGIGYGASAIGVLPATVDNPKGGPSSSVEVKGDVIADAPGGTGAWAGDGGTVSVNGNAKGGGWGVIAAGNGSKIKVDKDVTTTDGTAVHSSFGGVINVSGNASGFVGAYAKTGGVISIIGNVTASETGVEAHDFGSKITIGQNVTSLNTINGNGIYAADGGEINVSGEVSSADLGAYAEGGGQAIVGSLSGKKFIVLSDGSSGWEFPAFMHTVPSTKEGYLTYTDGENTIWVRDADTSIPQVVITGFSFDQEEISAAGGQVIATITGKNLRVEKCAYSFNMPCSRVDSIKLISNDGNTAKYSFLFNKNDTYDHYILPISLSLYGVKTGFEAQIIQRGKPIPDEFGTATFDLPDATQGSFYCCYLSIENVDPNSTWRVFGLPRGLSLNPLNGQLSGITYETGDFKITGTVIEPDGNEIDVVINLTVAPSDGGVQITFANVPNGRVGEYYEANFTAAGGVAPYTWYFCDPIPDGLSWSPQTGKLSGVPTTAMQYIGYAAVIDATGDSTFTNYFITILPEGLTDAEQAAADKLAAESDAAALTWDMIKGENTNENEVTSDLILPTKGGSGSDIEWFSMNPAISDSGAVLRPNFDEPDAAGVLTAIITKGNAFETVEFSLTVQKLSEQGHVCMIDSVPYFTLDEALAEVQSGQTIKLLRSINYNALIKIDSQTVTFDLDRFNLTVDTGSGRALEVVRGGKINVAGTGKFNIKGGSNAVWVEDGGSFVTANNVASSDSSYAVFAINGGEAVINGNISAPSGSGAQAMEYNSKVTVNGNILAAGTGISAVVYGSRVTVNGNVSIQGKSGDAIGIAAQYGSADVSGNVTVNGNYSMGVEARGGACSVTVGGSIKVSGSKMDVGVQAYDGCKVIVDGPITYDNIYIAILDQVKTPTNYWSPTTKTGYFTYTDGNSTVWIKESSAFVPVSEITGVPEAVMIGTTSLNPTVVPYNATGRTITWNVKDAGVTGATIDGSRLSVSKEGKVVLTATIENGLDFGVPYTQDFTVTAVSGNVCRIGNMLFTNLKVALAWASVNPFGAEIVLLRDIEYDGLLDINSTNVTFNLNGWKLTTKGLDALNSVVKLAGAGEFNVYGFIRCRAADVEVSNVYYNTASGGSAVYCYAALVSANDGITWIGGNTVVHGNNQTGEVPGKVHIRGDVAATYSGVTSGFAIECGMGGSVFIDGNLTSSMGAIQMGEIGIGAGRGSPDVQVKGNVYAGKGNSGGYAVRALAGGTLDIGGSLYGSDNLVHIVNATVNVNGDMRSSSGDPGHVGVYFDWQTYADVCTVEGDIQCVIKFGDHTVDTADGVLDGDPTMPGYYVYAYEGFAGKVYAKALPGDFVPVTDITGIPEKATAGTPLHLTGAVSPANATNKAIIWSVKDAGTTGAAVGGGNLNAQTAGTVILTATIPGGASQSAGFTKDFTVQVFEPVVPVTGIMGMPTAVMVEKPLTLTGRVMPDAATNKTIIWNIKDAGDTGAVLSGNTLTAQTVGTVIVTATIADGLPFGEPYTQDIRINVVASEYFCSIGDTSYTGLAEALAAVQPGTATTIKLLQPIVHTLPVVIDNKSITFDLNGFDLEIDIGNINNSTALNVMNGGNVYLEGSGEFNVTGGQYGVYMDGMCNVTVSNATSTGHYTGQYSWGTGAYVIGGSWLTVTGNVTGVSYGIYAWGSYNHPLNRIYVGGDCVASRGTSAFIDGTCTMTVAGKAVSYDSNRGIYVSGDNAFVTVGSMETHGGNAPYGISYGIWVNNGQLIVLGDCVINGRITGIYCSDEVIIHGGYTTDAEQYIRCASVFGQSDFITPSTKPGYLTYCNISSGDYTGGVVWIKDPGNADFIPVTDVTGLPYTMIAGQPLVLVGNVNPESASQQAIVWSIADAGTTGAVLSGNILTAKDTGTVTVRAAITDGLAIGTPFNKDISIRVDPAGQNFLCEIAETGVRYSTVEDALAAVGYGESKTIRLLKPIRTDKEMLIDNKSITFDLNGFELEIDTRYAFSYDDVSYALDVKNGGNVYLTGNGEFNVTAPRCAVRAVGSSEVTVSSAGSIYFGGSNIYSVVWAEDGARITVTGNVTGSGQGIIADGKNTGVFVHGNVEMNDYWTCVRGSSDAVVTVLGNVSSGGDPIRAGMGAVVTVGSVSTKNVGVQYYGIRIVTGAKVYILGDCVVNGSMFGIVTPTNIGPSSELTIEGAYKTNNGAFISFEISKPLTEDDYVTPTTKPGYITYAGRYGTVWIREPGSPSFIPVTRIDGVPDKVTAGTLVPLAGEVVPYAATNKEIKWNLKNAGGTGAAIMDGVLLASKAGTVVITAIVEDGAAPGVAFTQDFSIKVVEFTPVTNIAGVPNTVTAGTPLTLAGSVEPAEATNKKIIWSLKDAGMTEATLTGSNILNTLAPGTAVVTATIADGAGFGIPYTQDFPIDVVFVPVTDITGVLDSAYAGVNAAIGGTLVPANATYKDIVWSVADAGSTGAFITNNRLFNSTNTGTAVIKATIKNGAAPGIDYTQEFTVGVAPTLSAITIDTLPDKTVYLQGETLDLTGLVVIANYSDGSAREVTDYTTAPADGAPLDIYGTRTVEVTYTEGHYTRSGSFTVTVNEDTEGKPVCEIVGKKTYTNLTNALEEVQSGETIRLLANITYNNPIIVNNGKIINFDLGDFNLVVDTTAISPWYALEVNSGGQVYLVGTGTGELNLYNDRGGVYAYGVGSVATVNNVAVTGGSAVEADDEGRIIVNGDIDTTEGDGGYGVYIWYDGYIEVNGNIRADAYGVYWRGYGGTVNVNGDIEVYDPSWGCGVRTAYDTQTVVNGNIKASEYGVRSYSGADVTVNGNIEAYGNGIMSGGGNVMITGNIKAHEYGVYSDGGNITVTGDIKANEYGVHSDGGSVTVNGNIDIEAVSSNEGWIANARYNGHIAINGNATSSDCGIRAYSNSTVTVNGFLTHLNSEKTYIKVDDVEKGVSDFQLVTTKENYLTYAEGTSTVWVRDPGTIVPSAKGEIKIGANSWDSFRGIVPFELFAKSARTVTITADSSDTTIAYYVSDKEMASAELKALTTWKNYEGVFYLNPIGKYIVYARLTNTAGEAAFINTAGVVLYTDSEAVTNNIGFTKGSGVDQTAAVHLNGNTLDKIMLGGDTLTSGADYTLSSGTITFSTAYLDSLAVGLYTLTVYYDPLGVKYADKPGNDVPATTSIRLAVFPAAGVLESIDVIRLPDKTEYIVGQSLDLTGMIVKATYSDGNIVEITSCTSNPADGAALYDIGTQAVTISCTEDGVTKTAAFPIAVKAPAAVLESIAVTTPPDKTVYIEGETLDRTGMVVTASYDDGSTREVTGYNTIPVGDAVLTVAGIQGVTVIYMEADVTKTALITVQVNAVPIVLESIEITSSPVKTAYLVGEALDLSGLVVTATYSNGRSKSVSGYTTDPAEGAKLSTIGTQTVVINYSEGGVTKETNFAVTVDVIPVVLVSIAVTSLPAKTAYITGDPLDLAGMVVKATYSDGSVAEITGYTSNPSNGATLNNTGTQVVTVIYTEDGVTKTAAFPVTVTPPFVAVTDISGVTPSVRVGMPLTFTGTVAPFNATNKTIVWSVKDANGTGASFTGNTLSTTAAGTLVVTATIENGSAVGTPFTKDFTISANVLPANYVAVTNITGVPTTATVGIPLALTGTASPADATYKDIIWSIRDAGVTGASITGDILETTAAGTVVVTAAIVNGMQLGIPYTQDFTIMVNAVPVELESIAVTTPPAKTEYTEGESLDLIGMIVTASYSDNSTKPVTGYTTDPTGGSVLSAVGSHTVTVSYTEGSITKTVSFPITVKPELPTVTGVSVSPDTIEVQKGKTQRFTATVTGTNNPAQTVTWGLDGYAGTASTISDSGILTVGAGETETTLTVKATSTVDTSKSGTATVSVTTAPPAPVYGISADKTEIIFPAAFVGYDEQSEQSIKVSNTGNQPTGQLTVSISGTDFILSKASIGDIAVGGSDTLTVKPAASLGAGTHTATVTISGGNGITASVTVSFTVNSVVLESIAVTALPTKTEYTEGESLDLTGMVVTATYSDTSTKLITNYTTDPANNTMLNTVNPSLQVTVSYTEDSVTKAAGFTIAVNPAPVVLTGIAVETLPAKTDYAVNETLDLSGMVVKAAYSNGTFKDVTTTATKNPAHGDHLPTAGTQIVEVSYTDGGITETAEFYVTVHNPTITSVTVSPDSIEIQKGKTQQFHETVTGTYNPLLTVTWSVTGNNDDETVISGTGLLTVAAGETATSLTVTATSNQDVTKFGTAAVTVTAGAPAPSYGISLNPGDHAFPSATVGYDAQAALSVTVTNTGNQPTGDLDVALSGVNANSFTLNKTSISSIAVGGDDTFTVTPTAGLEAGVYTAKVTVSGENNISASFNVTFTVNAAPVVLSGIAVDPLPAKTAYTKGEALNLAGMVVKATYSDGNVVDVTTAAGTTPANGDTLNTVGQQAVTVSYTDGGKTETANFFVTVSNSSGGGDPIATVTSVTVSPPGADIQKGGTQQFAATVNGTNNPSQSVTWSISGNSDAGTGISDTGLLTVAAGETAATITVRATSAADTSISGTATVTVITGTPAPTYGIALDTAAITFPSAYTGYGTQNARKVTVTNTGNQPTGDLVIALSGADASSFSLNKTSIDNITAGGSDSFTVAPKTGLARGTYSATVSVSGSNGITASCTLSFTVDRRSSGDSGDSGDSDSGGSDVRDTAQPTPPANIEIDNGDTPLAGIDTPDNRNPDTGAPQTGDANNALGWIIILAVSAFGFFGTLLWGKRRRDKGTW